MAVKFLISDSNGIKFNPSKNYWNKIKLDSILNKNKTPLYEITILPKKDLQIVSNIHTNICDLGFEFLLKFILEPNFRRNCDHYIKAYIQNYSYNNADPDFRLFSYYNIKVTDFVDHTQQINSFIENTLNITH